MSGCDSPRRICLIRPSALGDVCRTVPVLVSLKRAYPDARIDWLVQDSFVPAVASHPDLNEAIAFPRHRFARMAVRPSTAREFLHWAAGLRARKYDLAIDCQGLARSAFFARLSGAPRRVGPAEAREFGWIFYTHRHHIPSTLHTVDAMLALIEAEGVEPIRDLRLHTAPGDATWWRQRRGELGIGNAPYVVLAPTSRWPGKRWPAERFASLVEPLHERGFQRIVIVGGSGEQDQCEALIRIADRDAHVVNLLGRTGVGQLMAVIADAALVVANDSAALHMAVGFNRRYLALFGPTDPRKVGPYGGDRWVVQKTRAGERLNHKDDSRGARAMERIQVGDVLGKLDELLSERPLERANGPVDESPRVREVSP